ncbi:MAG TPA: hypothetical protein VHL31_01860 [Geminicoccus sp.]|jgi:hypothetical protein|uniref:hypothetical protein n=1 Tax=Geminicoccus sp. TaxID=2024832 RepID=UPI002E377927|nr:hypothetical protein [Geminicoccus sp.]HEX2525032.1 hypothetical protein [Geminicoccus sp.]
MRRAGGAGGCLLLTAVLLAVPASAAVPPPPDPKPAGPAATAGPADQPADKVLAAAGGYELTRADADAYVDALVFCLAYAGQDAAKLAADRPVVRDHLAGTFTSLPEAAQVDLADMTGIWDRARSQWANLAPMEKNAFAYGVLALAFGEEDAGRILRWNPRGAMVEGVPDARGRLGGPSDLECIMSGRCGESGVRLPE